MSHYYENDENLKDEKQTVSFEIDDKKFQLQSNAGVFSKDKLDTGTRILLETVLRESAGCQSVLDLGCGIGVVGVVLSEFWKCHITGIDVNKRACMLARENYQKYNVDGQVLCQDGLDQKEYDCILLNPPIRTGKETIYRLFSQSMEHLKTGGCLWIVIRKQHGAKSALEYLDTLGQAKRVARDKGFWVLRIEKQ